MNAKPIKTSKGFAETCKYVCKEMYKARILASEGIRTSGIDLMIKDFEWQHRLKPEIQKPVFHGVLSFPKGERPDDKLLVELSREYLKRICVENTQYLIVKHTDTNYLHTHIVANKVNNEGRRAHKGLLVLRSILVARTLTKEYNLQPEQNRHRQELYKIIRKEMAGATTLWDLERGLAWRAVTMRIKYNEKTGQPLGISFLKGKIASKGSRIDSSLSLKNIMKQLEINRALKEKERLQEEERLKQESPAVGRRQAIDEFLRQKIREHKSLDERLRERLIEKEARKEQPKIKPKLRKGRRL